MGRLRFLLLLPLIGIAAVGLPQDGTFKNTYGYSFNNPTSAQLNKFAWDNMNSRMVYRAALKKKGYSDAQLDKLTDAEMKAAIVGDRTESNSQKAAQALTIANAATSFKPTGTRILMPLLVDQLTKVEDERKVLKEAFEQSLVAFEVEAKKEGFSNDVAAAIGFFTAVTFKLYDGKDPDEDGATMLIRAIQVKLDTPEYRKVSDEEKQRFYEFMVSMGAYMYMAVGDLDEKMKKELTDTAIAVVQKFVGIDVTKVKLTANGLEKR